MQRDPAPAGIPVDFVGRQWEVAILRREVDTSLSGRLRVAMLTGEPGIGKTRLMRELADDVRGHGAVVLQGGASDAEGMPPYLPFLEALGPYIAMADASLLCRQCGDSATILSTILPELTARLGPTQSPYALPQEQARLRLFEAIGRFLHAIAQPAGLLLLLDDLHWADASTLDLLVFLARRTPGTRLLILGGYRPLEAEGHPALRRALVELTRHRVLTSLSLGPLTPAELRELAGSSLDGDVGESVMASLYSQSGGNAFFAEELLRSWLDSSVLDRCDGQWQLVTDRHLEPPAGIVATVDVRLSRLPNNTQDMLRIAAIIGRSFDVELLANVAQRDATQVDDLLVPAVAANLLQRTGAAYSFIHDTVREATGAAVGEMSRRRIHATIAAALERAAEAGASHAAELAFHFGRAGNAEKGVDYALLAAEEAKERFAFAEALALYRDALTLLKSLHGPSDASGADLRSEITLRCAQAALTAGHESEAHTLFQEAYGRHLQSGDALAAARAARGMALALWRQGELHRAAMALDAALSHLKQDRGAEKVRVLVDSASVKNWLGCQPEGLAAAEQALALATEVGDRRLEAAACRVAGQLTAWGNDFDGGNRLLERALALAIQNDDPCEAAEICGVLANTSFATFDLERSRQVTLMRMEFARRSQQPHEMRHVYGWLAEICVFRGEWAEAEQLLPRAQAVVNELEDEEPRAALSRVRGVMAEYRGQLEEAAKWYADALSRVQSMGPQHLCWYVGSLARIELARGNRTRSRELMLQLEAAIGELQAEAFPAAPGLTDSVEWWLHAGDFDRARAHVERLRLFQGRTFLSAVDLTLARYERATGNAAAAGAYLERVERDVRRAQLRPQLVAVLTEKAKLMETHERRAATAALHEAIELCSFLGLQERAQQIKEGMLPSTPDTPPAGLSPRELEVLRLVATGQSNREIARLLVVSEKTVEHHVTSIFNKTGTSNRAGATAFALRHGLA